MKDEILLKTYVIDDKTYYVIFETDYDNTHYFILSNKLDNKDIIVRKVINDFLEPVNKEEELKIMELVIK